MILDNSFASGRFLTAKNNPFFSCSETKKNQSVKTGFLLIKKQIGFTRMANYSPLMACSNSPFSYISIMMSEPPMNSPLT
jgi:hypothetical protein